MAPVPDFTGYATRNGLKCADGRVIMPGAFKGNDGQRVPLVWQHGHDSPDNILGHGILTNVADGVRVAGYFNNTPAGQQAKQLVQHKDITALSIYANQLIQKGANVQHGNIREVSLVVSGANPGAYIDNVSIQHGDDTLTLDDEAIIYTDSFIELSHADADTGGGANGNKPAAEDEEDDGPHGDRGSDEDVEDVDGGMTDKSTGDGTGDETDVDDNAEKDQLDHSATTTKAGNGTGGAKVAPTAADPSVADVFNTLTEQQKQVVYAMIGQALDHSGTSADDTEGGLVPRNVFDQSGAPSGGAPAKTTLSHADVKGIMQAAVRVGSLKTAVEDYALAHGIDDIDLMFPEYKLLQDQPDFIKRRTEWVANVLGATRHSPFSRVKTILADITPDEARAKGYVKGTMKNEEFFGVTKRTTSPTTIYKKQKLDRDDILDITDFDIIAWLKGEMRLMLDEEVARAILIGDGRSGGDADKIKDPAGAADGAGIRSILNDHEIYTTTVNVNVDDANSSADEIVDAILSAMRFYRGTGMPTFYTTLPVLTKLLLAKDTLGRRLYATQAELAAAMMVQNIVCVEPMETQTSLLGIVVNLADYNIGADSGGEVSMFDFFDIDFNQQKYLIETRLSGALVKFKSALAIKKVTASYVLIDPVTAPTQSGNTVTTPAQAHVTYAATDPDGNAVTITSNSLTLTADNSPVTVVASPASGYFFATNAENSWVFRYEA
jgi:HK97 family phage prohead protease